jgi:hypothetical protein
LRYFFRRHLPPSSRILLIESGSRHLIESVIPLLRAGFGEGTEIDLVTCFPGVPRGCDGRVFRIGDYRDGAGGRARLQAELAAREYGIAGMICAAEPIMTKWKWWLAAHLKSKIFILNENGDYFWLDWERRRTMLQFAAYRAGLTGSAAVPALVRFFLFPLTLAYLILYACTVNLQRGIRLRRRIRLL